MRLDAVSRFRALLLTGRSSLLQVSVCADRHYHLDPEVSFSLRINYRLHHYGYIAYYDKGCRKVFIKNLPYECSEEAVKEGLKECGKVIFSFFPCFFFYPFEILFSFHFVAYLDKRSSASSLGPYREAKGFRLRRVQV